MKLLLGHLFANRWLEVVEPSSRWMIPFVGIVDAHEGKITAESEPARGSTFRIRMPRDTSNESAVEEKGMMMGAS